MGVRAFLRRRHLALALDEQALIRDGKIPRCPLCGGYHRFECPFLKEIEYDERGMRRRVVFHRKFAAKIRDIAYDDDVAEE